MANNTTLHQLTLILPNQHTHQPIKFPNSSKLHGIKYIIFITKVVFDTHPSLNNDSQSLRLPHIVDDPSWPRQHSQDFVRTIASNLAITLRQNSMTS